MSAKPDIGIRPEDIHWRVGSTFDRNGAKYGMLLGYIDARDAMAKLDALDANWSSHMEPIALGSDYGVRCTLTVNGVSREDVGVPSDTEGLKGAFSDALKRAAVHFGIGRELYDLPTIAVECEVRANGKVGRPKALPRWNGSQWTIDSALGWVRYEEAPPATPQPQAGSARARPAAHTPATKSAYDRKREELVEALQEAGLKPDQLEEYAALCGVQPGEKATVEQLDAIIAAVRGHGTSEPMELPLLAEDAPDPDTDPDGYAAWFKEQPSDRRAQLRAQGRAPKVAA